MRVAGFALIGLLSGAILGLICAILFVFLWYDVFGIGSAGPDGLGGIGMLVLLAIVLPLIGGIAGASWLGLRARSRPGEAPSCALVVALVLAPLLILFCAVLVIAG